MARIRSIKPEFWTSEQVMSLKPVTRLLFIGMWNFADDYGRMPVAPGTIKAQVMPMDAVSIADIRDMLTELSSVGLIIFYSANDREYLEITGWSHQKIDKPHKPKFPAPYSEQTEDGGEPSPNIPGSFAEPSPLDRIGEDKKGKKENVAKRVRDAYSEDFEKFWKGYPTTPVMSKKQAWAEWRKLEPDDRSAALAAVAPFKEWLAKQKDHPVVHACRFLSQRRFDGFKPTLSVASTMVFLKPGTDAWDAWQAVKATPTNKDGGWYFESEYPPGYEPKAA